MTRPGFPIGVAVGIGLLLLVAAGQELSLFDRPDPRSLALTPPAEQPEPVRLLMSSTADFIPAADERFEVWVCEVPTDTIDPTFYPSPMRVSLDPGELAATLDDEVTSYFETLSHGRYSPAFVAGETYPMSATESPQACLDAALDGSEDDSAAVLAVGTAEHNPSMPGGFGTPGDGCSSDGQCSAHVTGRGAYLGASDFHSDWGDDPPMDLLEHEIGHTLGWPHSGSATDDYASGLDMMSNSAAPRESDDDARDAQGTLAVNQLAAGWLPSTDVLLAGSDSDHFDLTPSNTASGDRLLILPVDAERFLTVEYLSASGLDEELVSSGVTITLVDQAASACDLPSDGACVRDRRQQQTVVGTPPFTDLLTQQRPNWTGFGWSIGLSRVNPSSVSISAEALAG